jgi:hypothetical protein
MFAAAIAVRLPGAAGDGTVGTLSVGGVTGFTVGAVAVAAWVTGGQDWPTANKPTSSSIMMVLVYLTIFLLPVVIRFLTMKKTVNNPSPWYDEFSGLIAYPASSAII